MIAIFGKQHQKAFLYELLELTKKAAFLKTCVIPKLDASSYLLPAFINIEIRDTPPSAADEMT